MENDRQGSISSLEENRITVENSNVSFPNTMLMHVEFDRVRHYWFEIIPNNLERVNVSSFIRIAREQTWLCSGFDSQRNLIGLSHNIFECFIDLIEHFRFGW